MKPLGDLKLAERLGRLVAGLPAPRKPVAARPGERVVVEERSKPKTCGGKQ